MNHEDAYNSFFPLINEYGKIYRKYALIYARPAQENEYIETWTADGLETTNYAKKDDFVVKNLQTEYQEEYIIPEEMFYQRYIKLYDHEDGSIYKPIGKIKAAIYQGSDIEFPILSRLIFLRLKAQYWQDLEWQFCQSIYAQAN
jgi:hypothetical protein